MPPQQSRALPSPREEIKALPHPTELLRLQHQIKEFYDSVAPGSKYKGKDVKIIPVWGNRERR